MLRKTTRDSNKQIFFLYYKQKAVIKKNDSDNVKLFGATVCVTLCDGWRHTSKHVTSHVSQLLLSQDWKGPFINLKGLIAGGRALLLSSPPPP